ncbi:MAG: hypothetical protein KGI98_15575 [Euryarchaeota archaeon]|nr:hypothetical protein [Euryarchaeota archaeon]
MSEGPKEVLARIRSDPEWFIRTVFGEELIGKQREIVEALRDRDEVYVTSCHASGKTFICARMVLWWLLAYPTTSKVVTTAPTWSQVENLLWKEINAAYTRAKTPLGGRMLGTRWDLSADSFAIGLSTDRPVNLQGFHAKDILVVVDEADGVPKEIWDALDGLLTSANAKIVAIGNPLDPTSEFKKRYDAAAHKDTAARIRISYTDIPNVQEQSERYPYLLTPKWVEDKRDRWGERSALWAGKVLGVWPDQGTDTLIPMSWLTRALGKRVPEGLLTYGVDVARFGSDRTVRTLMRGGWCVFSRATSQEDTMQTASRVLQDMQTYGPAQMAIDATGIGSGVVDIVRRKAGALIPIQEFNASNKAVDSERFENRAAEWWWAVREAFEKGQIGFDMEDPAAVDELVAELNQCTYSYTGHGARLVIHKFGGRVNEQTMEIEARAARSPDRADSFVLAFNAAKHYLTDPDAVVGGMITYYPFKQGTVIC